MLSMMAQQPRQRDLKYEKDDPAVTKPPVGIPRGYALVIGIANYKNLPSKAQLEFPERDAESMYSVLISPEGGNFKAEDVHRLIGPKATMANMRRELEEWLPRVAKDDDRVLIYFAGHGFVNNGRGYLAPYDIDPGNIAASGYPMDTLGNVIGSKIKGKWKVLLTDSCHSGSIMPASDAQTVNGTLANLQKSLFSLTASRDRELSYEGKAWGGGHGIFTYFVVKGLEGEADDSKDGIITADELAEYVHREVRRATDGKQNPTSERGSFDSKMLLAFNPLGAAPGTPPLPKTGTLVFVSDSDEVQIWLDGNVAGVLKKGEPLHMPGLAPGNHIVKGVRLGYEPDGPREEMVYPGGESTVKINVSIPRRRKKAAVDTFERGVEEYNKGTPDHYKKAAGYFQSALNEDPTYSQASLYLARSYNLLFDNDKAKRYFMRAIEIDPDYVEARTSYAGMLLDLGDLDESVRQLNAASQRDPANAQAYSLLAQALCLKHVYPDSIEASRKAIGLNSHTAEPHLWLADALRMNGQYKESVPEYKDYLRLSDFDSKLAGKMNYYVLGYLTGFGHKKRGNLQDIWKELRSAAYFGMCDSERKLSNLDRAIEYCQQSLVFDQSDPLVHYVLALAYEHKADNTGNIEGLPAARKHFSTVVDMNPDLDEAKTSKKNIEIIDAYLRTR